MVYPALRNPLRGKPNISKSKYLHILSNTDRMKIGPVQKRQTEWTEEGKTFLHFRVSGVTEREKTCFQKNRDFTTNL